MITLAVKIEEIARKGPMKNHTVYPGKGSVRKAFVWLCGVLVFAFMLTSCASMTSQDKGNLAKRVDKLTAKNRELSKKVNELERKLVLLESHITGGPGVSRTTSALPPPLPLDNPGGSVGASPPPGLSVVKLHPEVGADMEPPSDIPPDLPVGSDTPPPLFGEDPGFDEPASPSDSSPVEEVTPSASYQKGVPVEAATLYESAVGQFHKGAYEIASEAFTLYIEKYPGTLYESSSLFYLGECDFNLRKFSVAIERFRSYIMRYPKGKEAPMALLRLGISYLRMEDAENAKKAFRQTMERFPDTPAAKAAQQELENMP